MWQDFGFALRQLKTNLRFSVTVVLTLALGIGATTAIFSVVRGVLLKALPFPEEERIVSLQTIEYPHSEAANTDAREGTDGGVLDDVSFPDFFDWRQQSKTLESVASFSSGTTRKFSPDGNEMPRLVDAQFVSGDFFRVLGVTPILGRGFTVDDERDENHPIILSYSFWVSDFHSSPTIVGKHLRISDRVRTVVGVMPPGFIFPGRNEAPAFWGTFLRGSYDGVSASGIAQKETISPTSRRNDRPTQVMARLKPGVSMAQAQAELNGIQRSLAEQYPEDRDAYGVEVQSLLDFVSDGGGYRKALYLLFAAVTALLLIACANVAGLLLARGFARRHEFSVRVALGAKPAQIVRQVLIESVVLALCGGAIGVCIALALLKTVLVFAPTDLPRVTQVQIDWIVMAFALAISFVTGIAFGVFPAWAASRSDSSGLWRAGRGISGSRGEHRLRAIFVIAETAISLALLGGSGLLIGSFVETMRVPPGFDPHHVLTFWLGMSAVEYPLEKSPLFFRQLFPLLAAIPGVESVTSSYPVPLSYDISGRFSIAGRSFDSNDLPVANRMSITANYFETLRIPLLKGRAFDVRDDRSANRVAIVNQEFARVYFPNEDPIGKSIQPDFVEYGETPAWYEIVGVVAGIRSADLTDAPKPAFFLPYDQATYSPQAVIMRVSGDPRAYLNSVHAVVAGLNRTLPIFAVNTMDDLIVDSTASQKFEAALLTCFAGAALLLAAVGLYAALSEMVARRTFEIGLRVALGAQQGDVFRLIVRRGLILAVTGLVAGIGGFAIFGRVVADMLYGVRAFEPAVIAMACAVMLVVAFVASAAPAWRAARLEPTVALREE
ncbi:MAG: ABC transporter permease [Acidobacteria bacterium]|nr:ABC transporter permease [Acidobacteriota bacterium]